MSKYTTELRYVCEAITGVESDFSNVDDVIEQSWDKIFTTKCEFFSEEYRKTLCCKILKHFYTREIGYEVVGLWKLAMNRKLEEIMPYYNQLYESKLLEFDPFTNTKTSRTLNRNTTDNTKGTINRTSNATSKENTNVKLRHSDTPQGGLRDITDDGYLSSADVNDSNRSNNADVKDNENRTDSNTGTEKTTETYSGKTGGESYSELLLKYRDTFINIDMMVIEEFNDLFMLLW